jgi:c-di-GMP-binding flagellar brake protein YcgR
MSANGNVTVVPSGDLNYLCGKKISIQLEAEAGKIACTCRGVAFEKYLMVQMAVLAHQEGMLDPGAVVIVRYLIDGSVYGFRSRVIQAIIKPFRLVFIEYPSELELYKLRTCERIDLFIKAGLSIHDMTLSGVIVDLSCGGCLMVLEGESVGSGLLVAGQEPTSLTFSIDSEIITLPCRIVRIMEEAHKQQLGIAFEFEDASDAESIRSYVDQLAEFRY